MRGNNRGKGGTQRRNRGILDQLLADLEVAVMVMTMVAMMNYHHNLRLRRIG